MKANSYQIISEYRPVYFFMENYWNRVIVHENSYYQKRQNKNGN